MAQTITISRTAKLAGVGVETIRFYERRGLVAQPRQPRDGGYRVYDYDVIERIRFIRQAQELGFSLAEIGDLLSLRASPSADCGDVRIKAVAKRTEVNRKIAQLQHIRAALDELIATCPGGGALRACTILDAMAGRTGETPKKPKAASKPRPLARQKSSRETEKKRQPMKTTTFSIDGMHCDGCARTVDALVSSQTGVQMATVSFENREARILYDPQTVSEERLAALIEQAGYSVARKT